MFETYYEAKMASMDGYDDYKDSSSEMYATCKTSGRIKEGEPKCKRNPDGTLASRAPWCIYYRSNKEAFGHCDHRYPPKVGNP